MTICSGLPGPAPTYTCCPDLSITGSPFYSLKCPGLKHKIKDSANFRSRVEMQSSKNVLRHFFSPCFLALCASVFAFILKLGIHGLKLAIGISVLLPCKFPSVFPIGCSQLEARWASNLWGSVPCDMKQSKGRERKRPKDRHDLLGCVSTGMCSGSVGSAWVTYPLWSGRMGVDLIDWISWSEE